MPPCLLAEEYHQLVTPISQISESQNIPKKFLEQILNDLKSGGFVESRRGPAGGYRLARPPQTLSLSEIIRHIEGALAPVSCVSQKFYEKCSCPDESRCALRSVMGEIREAIVRIADRITLADLSERARRFRSQENRVLDYSI